MDRRDGLRGYKRVLEDITNLASPRKQGVKKMRNNDGILSPAEGVAQ